MSQDRITELRIRGMRTIDDVTLKLDGLTVLIGDNGSGKSTLLEALELLRQAAKPVGYVQDILVRAHGGLRNLLRQGATELSLSVTIEGAGPRLDYGFVVANVGTAPEVVGEQLVVHGDSNAAGRPDLSRKGSVVQVFHEEDEDGERTYKLQKMDSAMLAVASFGIDAPPVFLRVTETLGRIEQHVPFETRPLWQQQELGIVIGPRWPAVVESAHALARYGLNLPNCYQQLRNLGNDVWKRVIERASLGLGSDLRDLTLQASGRGQIELEVLFGSAPDKPLPAECLSEGQLSYLAFIALAELNEARSLLAIDEPELHLHPALLSRVVWMLEQVAETCPVIVATHSDGLLDALADPSHSVVLCELDERRTTRLRRPNAERLAEWLEDYRGLGAVRAEGYEAHVFDDASTTSKSTEDGR